VSFSISCGASLEVCSSELCSVDDSEEADSVCSALLCSALEALEVSCELLWDSAAPSAVELQALKVNAPTDRRATAKRVHRRRVLTERLLVRSGELGDSDAAMRKREEPSTAVEPLLPERVPLRFAKPGGERIGRGSVRASGAGSSMYHTVHAGIDCGVRCGCAVLLSMSVE
jgi:hypothetical protein